MGQLTVKEKEHWKERIGRKIEKAIETLVSKEDPGFLTRVESDAERLAYDSLRLTVLKQQFEDAEKQEEKLKVQKRSLWIEMLVTVTGKSPHDYGGAYHFGGFEPQEVKSAVSRRQAVHEEQLMEADPLGRQILALRQEREELLDTVWLATSSSQIKELWQRVADLLEQPPTPLQKKALSLASVEDA